jgi:hypothetical protein
MINVKRGAAPLSLQKSEIQQYLNELAAYKSLDEDERKNAKRPECSVSYRNADLFEAFDRDFFAKCYLTEKRYVNSWAMDVEHFKVKAFDQQPELKYEWANLYPANHDANMVKPRKDPEGGYLDPCNDDVNVETELLYTLGPDGFTYFKAADASNIKACNTATLLGKIHNGDDFESNKKTATLRHEIFKKEKTILNAIIEWQGAENPQDKFEAEVKLKILLSRKSSFTMLMRSISAVRRFVPHLLD